MEKKCITGTPSTVKARVDAIANNHCLTLTTKPTTVKLELTGCCTLDCVFCAHHYMAKNKIRQKLLTQEEFDLAYNYIKSIPSIKEIGLFYMGESSLHPNLARFYKAIKKDGYFTYLTTNATKIDTTVEAIPYIDSLKVSWNYKNVTDFENKTRHSKEMYYLILNNIAALADICHKNNKKIAVSTVLDDCRESYREILSTILSMVDEHYFIPLQTQGGTFDIGTAGVVGEADNPVNPIPCWSLFKGLYIDCDLNVRTCCYGHNKDHILGNIKDNNIQDNIIYKQQQLNGKIPNICKKCLRNQ